MTVRMREKVLLDGGAGRQSEQDEVKPVWSGGEGRDGVIDSRSIFGVDKEVRIRHGDQLYRLRITRYGKLILNK